MKINAKKRVLALILTLAMLLPNFTGAMLTAQADTITAEANVYDISDLTGSLTNTIKGTNDTWDGQIHANVKEEHKENIVFKTVLTMGEQEMRFSLNAKDGASIYDPSGYAVYMHHNNGAPYIAIKRNQRDLAVEGIASVAGTYELEIGMVDILTDGVRTGKHLYVKKDGVVVCEANDTDGYLTGDALGTKIVEFHYGAAIQMDTTYTNAYSDVKAYDIYDLTGVTNNVINGTGKDNWSTTVIGNIGAADKENVSFKANVKIVDDAKYRFSLGALASDDCVDPAGYGFEIVIGAEDRVTFARGSSHTWIKSWDEDTSHLKGEYELEFGYQDISFGGNTIGKRIFLKKNGEVLYSYDDMDGYLTGDQLGTKVAMFHYGTAVAFNTTYESGYGEANVYDIYDLTGTTAKQVNAWNPTEIGSFAAENKEQAAVQFKMNITNIRHRYRLAVGNTTSGNGWDPKGYGIEIAVSFDGQNHVKLLRNGGQIAKFDDISGLIGEHIYEFGYRNITMGNSVLGKQVYLKVDGVILYSFDDASGYLTGDALGNLITLNHIDDSAVQLNTAYESGYGEEKVYDIADLTGADSNTINGTGNGNWSTTVLGNIDVADKESVSFKANVKIVDDAKYRFSLGALESDDCVDPAGYGFELVIGKPGTVAIIRGSSHTWIKSWSVDTTNLLGEYELEFGYRDITFKGNLVGKQIFLMKNGEVLYTYDDKDGFLTGDQLGTKVAMFHYGSAVEMNTTKINFVDSYNLTLGGSTVMNLRLDPVAIGDAAATVTVSVGGADTVFALQDLTLDADGLRVVSVPLAAAQMQDEVLLTVNLTNGNTLTKSYTVAGYAKVILEEAGFTAEQKATLEAMLHYGAAAQNYFGYNTENPANAGYTDSVNNTIGSTFVPVLEGKVSGVSLYGTSLLMQENNSLRFYLKITGDVSKYTVTLNGEKAELVSTDKVSSANYYVQLDGILPNELDGVYVLSVSDGNKAMTYQYSPMSYIQRMSTNDSMKELVQQLYDYHMAAKALAGSKVVDNATILDLYQLSQKKSVTIPVNQVMQLGVLAGTEGSFIKKELTSNSAIRFQYTGGEGMRIQFGASTPEINIASGALFMSVPDNNSFGIADISDNGTWCKDASGQDLFSWQQCLGRGQTSYIELGCVRRYTDGVYTHDRYYVRAAASLAELDAMVQNGTFSVYYDTTMKDNNGHLVIVRSRMDNGGDVLATTWTDAQIEAYEARMNAIAQSATSGSYDALEKKYPADVTDTSNTASSVATAENPTGSTQATGGDELILWAESGTSKIVQDDDGKAATLASRKNTLTIQMAKNEDEGAQLMLFGNRNVESYEIFVTDLTSGSNVISAENIRLYQLKYLTVADKAPSENTYETPSAYKGEKLPDGMLPFAKAVEYGENVILAGNNQAIYVDVSSKTTDAAGTYTGTIVVKTNTNQVYTLPVSVTVENVVMPENSKLGTYAPYFGRDGFATGELDGSDEMAALYTQILEDFNMSAITPASDGKMNMEKFLVNLRRSYDATTNYLLPVDNSDCYYVVDGVDTLVYCNYALLKEYVVAVADMSIADGKIYLDKAFFYPSDHVDESKTEAEFALAKATYQAFCQMLDDADAELSAKYAGTSKYTAEIANSVKNLRFLLTVPGDDDYGKSLDVDVLLTEFLKGADRKNVVLCTSNEVLVREGYGDNVAAAMNGAYADELWTYLSLKPYAPYSNYAFDTPVVGLRTLGWTCYQENIDTLMAWKTVDYLYGADGQSLDRWTTSSAGTSTITPGDGNIFYPGAKYGIDGACPSLRAMAWRDGVDDYNLMYAVQENGGSAASLNQLYSLITKSYTDSIKTSAETGSWWGSLVSKTVKATVPVDDDVKFTIVRNALLKMAASNASEHSAIISNAQSAVNGVVAASGTVNALEAPGAENTVAMDSNIYVGSYYQLADFESYEQAIVNKFSGNAQLALSNMAMNGSYSLKIAVQPGQGGEKIMIPTTSKYFSATTNFSVASKITFMVYNAQATESTVRFYLNTYDRSNDVYNAGTYFKDSADVWHDDHYQNTSIRFTLAPGWNEITINAEDLGQDYLSYVGAFIIAFDSGAGYNAEQVFYLDDVRVYMNKVA